MKTALITGGSSGIGFEMSKHFAKNGYRLLWVSKPPEELAAAKIKLEAEVQNVKIHTLAKDLATLEGAHEVFDWTRKNWKVDVLINNAGFGTYGYCNEISMEKEIAMIHLNTLNVYQMTRLFLKEMQSKNEGTIINISSISAFQPVARLATYSSTKAFVGHFSKSLQEELSLQKSNVKVITVYPAPIKDTAFKTTANMEDVKYFDGLSYTTAEEVGRDVWEGFQKGKTVILTGKRIRLLRPLYNILPNWFIKLMVQRETVRK